jgi:hypothetical protein
LAFLGDGSEGIGAFGPKSGVEPNRRQPKSSCASVPIHSRRIPGNIKARKQADGFIGKIVGFWRASHSKTGTTKHPKVHENQRVGSRGNPSSFRAFSCLSWFSWSSSVIRKSLKISGIWYDTESPK